MVPNQKFRSQFHRVTFRINVHNVKAVKVRVKVVSTKADSIKVVDSTKVDQIGAVLTNQDSIKIINEHSMTAPLQNHLTKKLNSKIKLTYLFLNCIASTLICIFCIFFFFFISIITLILEFNHYNQFV